MISKAKVKFIRSLERKKVRMQEGVFVAEGPKVVGELLQVAVPTIIVSTSEWKEHHPFLTAIESYIVTEDELRQVSFLQHPQEVLAIFPFINSPMAIPSDSLTLALDGIQDPGNLGTIIRIADWFGIKTVYCSLSTVDVYNPKVMQATMGSIARVRVIYTDLLKMIDSLPADYPVYGTFLDGDSIYQQELPSKGMIVMGNEGNGVSSEIASKVTRRLLIPHYPQDSITTDSLNVAIATAITCAEFRRRQLEC